MHEAFAPSSASCRHQSVLLFFYLASSMGSFFHQANIVFLVAQQFLFFMLASVLQLLINCISEQFAVGGFMFLLQQSYVVRLFLFLSCLLLFLLVDLLFSDYVLYTVKSKMEVCANDGKIRTENIPAQVTTILLTKNNYLTWSAAIIDIASREKYNYIASLIPSTARTNYSRAT